MHTALDGLIEIWENPDFCTPRLRGTRIRVEDVVRWHETQGISVETIVHDFPQLSPATVHAALAYYWEHKDAMDQLIADGKAYVEAMKRGETSHRLVQSRGA